MQESLLAPILFLSFILALFAPLAHKLFGRKTGGILALIPAAVALFFCSTISQIASGKVLIAHYSWFPAFGVNFSFLLDGLSLAFVLLITVIGALVLFYASAYMKGNPHLGRFYLYLMLFMASMLGLVLSDNLITLFVFWELTSITSFLLIGFKHEAERSRWAALQALLVTAGGGLALFGGMLMLQWVTGTFSISAMSELSATIHAHPLYLPLLILVLLGAFTKSAQFPFHFWLPNAMEAPTPVSAYLHSATMVKAGVYLLARLNPVLGGTVEWHSTLIITGLITMLLGAVVAVLHRDLKKILAFTTISSLGILVMLIGVGTEVAIVAAVGFLLVHALYKGTLFLVAGAIDLQTGTRDLQKVGGLFKAMPIVGVAAILAALSNAGLPPFIGFIGKEMIYEGTLSATVLPSGLITAVAVVANMFIVATAIMAGVAPFAGIAKPLPRQPKRMSTGLWFGALVLGALGLLAGVLSGLTSLGFVSPAVDAVLGYALPVKLKLWHGFNFVLLLSTITIAGGVGIYFLRMRFHQVDLLEIADNISFSRLYDKGLSGFMAVADWQTRMLQNGYMRHYLLWLIFTLLGLCTAALVLLPHNWPSFSLPNIVFYELVICAIIVLAAVVAAKSKKLLTAVASMGMVGYGIALIFIFYGAPDLAMTMFIIETLTVVLFVLVIYRLPKFSRLSKRYSRWRDGVVAVVSGGMVSLLMLLLMDEPVTSQLSPFFLENSYVMAKGRNVVNVILVDFRALDTLGEIVVLCVAAIGAYSLVKFSIGKAKVRNENKGEI